MRTTPALLVSILLVAGCAGTTATYAPPPRTASARPTTQPRPQPRSQPTAPLLLRLITAHAWIGSQKWVIDLYQSGAYTLTDPNGKKRTGAVDRQALFAIMGALSEANFANQTTNGITCGAIATTRVTLAASGKWRTWTLPCGVIGTHRSVVRLSRLVFQATGR